MPRRSSNTKVSAPIRSWWITGGDEECAHCGQLYAVEMELRCADCDGPMCLHCVVLIDERKLCADCVPAGER